ncbi:VOC family protein, partial [Achromobacter xylosoxidans]
MNPTSKEPPRLFPTLRCQDPDAMMRWLTAMLGFTELAVYRDGAVVQHAEMACGSSILMLGQHRDDDYGKQVGDPQGR